MIVRNCHKSGVA